MTKAIQPHSTAAPRGNGVPIAVNPERIRELAAALIDFLDAMEADPDLEPSDDAEPDVDDEEEPGDDAEVDREPAGDFDTGPLDGFRAPADVYLTQAGLDALARAAVCREVAR